MRRSGHLSLVPPLAAPVATMAVLPETPVARDRDRTIAAIRAALRQRSGRIWSVRGGRGTSWGWITICAPPSRCDEHGHVREADRAVLAELLGLPPGHVGYCGVSVANSSDYRREFIARAQGRAPEVIGKPYWD